MNRPLTVLQWAAIAAIRAEPGYRFVRGERTLARRLAQRKLIRSAGAQCYRVTPAGARAFAACRSAG